MPLNKETKLDQSFLSPKLVALPRLENLVYAIIYL